MKNCPKCESYTGIRVKRKGIYKIIPFLKIYKCRECHTVYYWIKGHKKVIETKILD